MNDFTKDELQIILLEINIGIKRYGGILKVAESLIDIRDKIESMIDNYCEHDWGIGGGECICCKLCEKEIVYNV